MSSTKARTPQRSASKDVKDFGDTATRLAKNPLGIIALFIVLVYGFAALVTAFAGTFATSERLPLIWFLVLFPVLVLSGFRMARQPSWRQAVRTGRLPGRGKLHPHAIAAS